MNSRVKAILIPFLVTDAIFLAGLAYWLYHRRQVAAQGGSSPGADIQVELRHLEAKLTEVDLINNGGSAGSLDLAVDVTWPDADLSSSEALDGFDEFDTGRRSLEFRPQASVRGKELAPAARREIGWIQLTDDVPLNASITLNPPATQP